MTKSRKNTTLLTVSALVAILAVLFVLFSAKPAYAGTVQPSGKKGGYTDKTNIQRELNKNGTVTLVKGKTYYLDGALHISSNQTINAKGATIVCKKCVMFNIPTQTKYKSIENFTLNGGYWKYPNKNGNSGSSIKIIHGNNITIKNVRLNHAKASGHSIELVACKNVVISNCVITPLGSSGSQTEEAVQLDVATHTTAYFLESSPFKSSLAKTLQNGATCKNITIQNNTIIGNRGVVANYTRGENGKYLKKLHTNIVIKNNKITGLKGEGVSLFNTKSATVCDNTIISKASGSGSAYTIGLHFACFGSNSKLSKGKITVINNTVKGGRQAMQIYSHTSSKYGTVIIKKNKLYCKKGKGSALKVLSCQCLSLTKKSNKFYGWNGK